MQDYINSYEEFMKEYKEAMESQDMDKVQALTMKGEELSAKAGVFSNMTEGDSKKLTDYLQAKAKEMQEIAMKVARE
ncbi:hypothetical protein GO491_05090 [Flavobacteriaceae bacterium Ap0902]|nr:hypothetical protein [Flavobacteriaceae bacterium Ap0902]